MKTNNYSSDLGINKNRVDIKLKCKDGLRTIKEVIDAIKQGDTFIKANLKCPLNNRTYTCKLVKEIEKIGIEDVRFGGMSHYLGDGVGYTLYKA